MAFFCAPGTGYPSPSPSRPDPAALMAQMMNNQGRKRAPADALTSAEFLDLAAARLLRQQGAQKQHHTTRKAAMLASALNSFLAPESLGARSALEASFLEGPGPVTRHQLANAYQHSADEMPPFAALPRFSWGQPSEASEADVTVSLQTLSGAHSCVEMGAFDDCASTPALVSQMPTSEIVRLLQQIEQHEGILPATSANGPVKHLVCAKEQVTAGATDLAFLGSPLIDVCVESGGPPSSACASAKTVAPTLPFALAEDKRLRRLAGNREAARRLRKRHSERIAEMEGEMRTLKRVHEETCQELKRARARIAVLAEENSRLEEEAQALQLGAAKEGSGDDFSICASLKEVADILFSDDL